MACSASRSWSNPITGLLVETLLAAPLAIAYLVHLWRAQAIQFFHVSRQLDAMLVFLGVVTAVPLLLFTPAPSGCAW